MEKRIMDFMVKENRKPHNNYGLLILTPANGDKLPEIKPGQFMQVRVDNSKTTFLRRPISINFVDYELNELWLLIRKAGPGTNELTSLSTGDNVNVVLPLGNGFTIPANNDNRILLIGGGVGVAPLLYFGKILKDNGLEPAFLLGARSESDLLQVDEFKKYGNVYVSTDDGSAGEHGVVTTNSVLEQSWDTICCCGPAPMMKAVADVARKKGTRCEVSLENMMACGIGACLCCVEKTVKGNVCVCTEGPVFNIDELTW